MHAREGFRPYEAYRCYKAAKILSSHKAAHIFWRWSSSNRSGPIDACKQRDSAHIRGAVIASAKILSSHKAAHIFFGVECSASIGLDLLMHARDSAHTRRIGDKAPKY